MYERRAPKSLEFISGRYHILREIYQKFGRISSVKWTSLYFKSRAKPAIKHTSRIHSTKTQVGPQNYSIRPTEYTKQLIYKTNSTYQILIIY